MLKTVTIILATVVLTLTGTINNHLDLAHADSYHEQSVKDIKLSQLVKPRLAAIQAAQELERQRVAIETAKVQKATEIASLPPQEVPRRKEDLLEVAGIPKDQWHYVDYIVSNESGWRPEATNPSGAHGLPQALPYSKTGCGWTDAVCQLKWADQYAKERYGGWARAYSYWQNNHVW